MYFAIQELEQFFKIHAEIIGEYNGGGDERTILGFEVDTMDENKAIEDMMERLKYFKEQYCN